MALIFLGYGLKQSKFLADEAWSGIEKLTYYILFPALLIHTLGNQTLAGTPWPSMLMVVVGTLMISATVLIVWHRVRASESNSTFTSVFQGGVRFNTYIALAVAQGLFGLEGLALGSVAAGFMIVLINMLCISVFVVWGKTNFKGITSFIREVIGNPLILGCAIGWFLSLSGLGLPGITDDILEIIGRAALPFGLLAVGAALNPKVIHGHVKPIVISSVVQFGLKPLIAALLISSVALNGVPAAVLVIAFITPTAPSAYILARQLGGDTETMASVITFQTLLAFLVMPLMALFLLP
ncbi:MAG: AEC family transporter [Candidatus Thiodiazotropha sp. (ex Codakia rugifera)]|nr:AEC family transporter [Candidatus Thiodiazotropha sp. (ex Codakia rugifera)]